MTFVVSVFPFLFAAALMVPGPVRGGADDMGIDLVAALGGDPGAPAARWDGPARDGMFLADAHSNCAEATTDEPGGLTFFGWSDQHVKTDGDIGHVAPFVEAMNSMAGTPYPPAIGGRVTKPAFVVGAGDITEWPTHAAMQAYDSLIRNQLKIPAYDILGNHDDGGQVPSDTMTRWMKERHGSLSYAFDAGGVRFIAFWSRFDPRGEPAQPLASDALEYVRQELAKVRKGRPIVLITHLCFDAMTNRDELFEAIGRANVILILGGHYHQARVHRYKGLNWVQLPSPKSTSTEFTVLRVARDRLLALPYDFRKKAWAVEPDKILNVAIEGP